MSEVSQLAAMLERVSNRLRGMVARGVVKMVSDGLKMQAQQIQLLDGEIVDNVERPQQYGFTSVPHGDAECFVVFVGGGREHGIILSVDDRRYRLKGLQGGEVALYTDEGDKIVLKRQNTIEVTTKKYVVKAEDSVTMETKTYTVNASEGVNYNTPSYGLGGEGGCAAAIKANMAIEGDTTQKGNISSTGDQIAGGVSQINHPHTGVQPGSGQTGKPVGGA
ncbi:phage baseplate assembly protein V [uncultured Desulfovibrio sp.]|uniref:phage baseplate assembly protein V n=1 Tax=uncultured Desulfovibrio sp. TaxID=167968 RepID=UPI002600DC93|nr:phage baseplate assembly protein V [uncultured Desulfovibrio sp.]